SGARVASSGRLGGAELGRSPALLQIGYLSEYLAHLSRALVLWHGCFAERNPNTEIEQRLQLVFLQPLMRNTNRAARYAIAVELRSPV
ncbi:MAG: hypothetical protein ACPGWS_07655, partial [Solirubrobacterales bacterium]